jgi:ABC-type transport system involved in cytochrome c biogenesis permease subunit
MPSRRAAYSSLSLTVAVLTMLLRLFFLGSPDGAHQIFAGATSLIVLAGLAIAIGVAVSNKLRGQGELLVFVISLLVTVLTLAYTALMMSAFNAAAHS